MLAHPVGTTVRVAGHPDALWTVIAAEAPRRTPVGTRRAYILEPANDPARLVNGDRRTRIAGPMRKDGQWLTQATQSATVGRA